MGGARTMLACACGGRCHAPTALRPGRFFLFFPQRDVAKRVGGEPVNRAGRAGPARVRPRRGIHSDSECWCRARIVLGGQDPLCGMGVRF